MAIPICPRNGRSSAGFSPYHNVEKSVKYPRTLFTTSTRDDRVHPGHARKMVAKMKQLGHEVDLLRKHRGGPRRCRRQQAGGVHAGDRLYVPLE